MSALADTDLKTVKPIWVNCKPYFSNQHSKADNDIALNENGKLILKKQKKKLQIPLMIILVLLFKTLTLHRE